MLFLPPAEFAPPPEPREFISQPSSSKAMFMHSRIQLSSGVELDVLQSGDPTGAPLLLLHGLSDSAPSMRPLMEALPPGIRAIAITQRGHGDSSKPAGPYTLDVFVADAAEAMDRLGVRRAAIYGHSMGSVIAQRFAATRPERTSALILEGAFPGLKGNAAAEDFYRSEVVRLTDPIDPGFAREFQQSTLSRPVPPGFLDLITAESQKLPAHAWKAIVEDLLARETDADLRRIRAPTLILWGDQDIFAGRAEQDRLTAGIRGARLETFVGTGHDPHWEEPERAARLVGDFVQAHARRAQVAEAAQ